MHAKTAKPGWQTDWEKTERARLTREGAQANATPVEWRRAGYLEYTTESNASFRLLEDNSLLSDGRGAFNDTYRVVATTSVTSRPIASTFSDPSRSNFAVVNSIKIVDPSGLAMGTGPSRSTPRSTDSRKR